MTDGSPQLVGEAGGDRAPGAAERDVAVRLRGITKVFPGVRANDGVDLSVRYGEVLCLLGENGAGKSTLMSVLAGIHRPDEGVVYVNGAEVTIASPRDAIALGIGMVHQHSSLIPSFTVLENLMLGRGRGVRLDFKAAREGLTRLAAMLGVEVDADVAVERLSLGQQQQVEIIKTLWQGSSVLILDEPTSMLTPKGIDDLQQVLLHLRREGLAIVFITHKLDEAFSIGDTVAVLRQGRLVGGVDRERMKSAAPDELRRVVTDLMFPGEAEKLSPAVGWTPAAGPSPTRELPRAGKLPPSVGPGAARTPLLELTDVTVAGRRGEVGITEPLTLTIHNGEVVGIAGVDGSGQLPLAEAIAGQRPPAGGDIRLLGKSLRELSIGARQRLGLRYVTDDRWGEGVVGSLSVAVNLVSKRIGRAPFWVHGRARPAAIDRHAQDLVDDYDIKTPSIHTPAGTLSGGNAQKMIVARELSFEPRMVVFNKPTYGLDVKTTAAVRARIRGLVAGGAAGALVISTDLEELLALCDRVAVLVHGRLTGIVSNEPGAVREIGALMIGAGTASDVA